MSSLPNNLKDELQSLIKLFIPTIVCLKNKISSFKCQSKTRRKICGRRGKIQFNFENKTRTRKGI
jgi:hypothetical protein